jgi:hypothetical protein
METALVLDASRALISSLNSNMESDPCEPLRPPERAPAGQGHFLVSPDEGLGFRELGDFPVAAPVVLELPDPL